MAVPVPQALPTDEEVEHIFRTVRGDDGEVRILQLPATLENLLDPRREDQVTQSHRHLKVLVSVFDALRRYLERLSPELAVFSDLLLLYKRHGFRDVSPDIAVVEGLANREAVDDSLDVIAEKARLRLVMEVVSTSTRDQRRKDEEANLELFARIGVEDYVLLYPPQAGEPLRAVAWRLSPSGDRRLNRPDRQGRVLLRSLGLWLSVDETRNYPVLGHRETGERLLTSEEEEAARRRAERRAAETLVMILESRGLRPTEDERLRILACRDPEKLGRWTRRAFTVSSVDDLLTTSPRSSASD